MLCDRASTCITYLFHSFCSAYVRKLHIHTTQVSITCSSIIEVATSITYFSMSPIYFNSCQAVSPQHTPYLPLILILSTLFDLTPDESHLFIKSVKAMPVHFRLSIRNITASQPSNLSNCRRHNLTSFNFSSACSQLRILHRKFSNVNVTANIYPRSLRYHLSFESISRTSIFQTQTIFSSILTSILTSIYPFLTHFASLHPN